MALDGAVDGHHCTITDADVCWLMPTEQHDLRELVWGDQGGMTEHPAILLAADSHVLMTVDVIQKRTSIADIQLVVKNWRE